MPRCLSRPILALVALSIHPMANALERVELLPPEAHTFATISNTTNFWSSLQKSSVGRLWMDRQFQDFLGNPDAETWQALFLDGETDAEDQVFLEQLKMLGGELALAFDLKTGEAYIVAAMGKADFDRSLELDEKLNETSGNPFKIIKSSFQDVEIIQHIEDPGTPEESSSWQAHVGNTFVLGHTCEWVERCIAQLRKEEVSEPTGNPVLELHIPLADLFRESIPEGSKGDDQRNAVKAFGLMGMERFTTRIELLGDRMLVDNNMAISDLQRGLFSLLDTKPSELPTVTFIPENISSLEVGRFSLLGLWREIPLFLGTAQPQAKPQFDMMTGMLRQQTGIDIEQDLLAHLGTQYISFSTIEGERQVSAIALELEDGMAFKQGLERALAAPAIQPYVASGLELTDFLDHTIYTLKNAQSGDDMGVALIDDYLLYGTVEGLRQVIRSESSEAAANTAFERSELVQGLRANLTPRAFGFSVVDWRKNMAAIIAELTKPEITTAIQQQWAKAGSPLPPPDFNKLPPADHIASFFNVSYQYTEESKDGLHQRIILKY